MPKSKDHQLSQAQAQHFREKIHSVVDVGKKSSIDMCQMVWESNVTLVRVEGDLKYCWQAWGYTSWEEFLGREMHLHLQTAYGLCRVWQTFFVDMVNDWDHDLLLGITKMRLLTRVKLTPRNVEYWLKRAAGMNCAKLLATVSGVEETHSFAVQMSGSQMNSIRKTMDALRNALPNGENMSRADLLVYMAKVARDSAGPALRRAA